MASFHKVRRQPKKVHPQDPAIAEVHAAQKPEIPASKDAAPRYLWGRLIACPKFGQAISLAHQLQFLLIYIWVILGAIPVIPKPNHRPHRANRSEDVENRAP